jgi:hypothetical protein
MSGLGCWTEQDAASLWSFRTPCCCVLLSPASGGPRLCEAMVPLSVICCDLQLSSGFKLFQGHLGPGRRNIWQHSGLLACFVDEKRPKTQTKFFWFGLE